MTETVIEGGDKVSATLSFGARTCGILGDIAGLQAGQETEATCPATTPVS